MWKAGVTEIKASLSEVLARVKAGEEVLVTERGRPIARIVPLLPGADGAAGALESTTEDLVRAGVLAPPTAQLGEEFWRLPRPADPQALALAALIEERRTGR